MTQLLTPAAAWWSDYTGLPYRIGGRDRSGIDCWGLVRLVHAERFGVELPSLSGSYESRADVRIPELIAQQREGWARVDGTPRAGDLVLFRVLGSEWHAGICTEPGRFLHAREGATASCIERLDSPAWSRRREGIYRYTPGAGAVAVSACPHPLRVERLDAAVPAGMTLAEVAQWLRTQRSVPAVLPVSAVMMLDGVPVPPELWTTTRAPHGARIEYRAVPRGSGALRAVLMIAVAVAAWYVAPLLMGYGAGAAGWAAAAAAGTGPMLAVAGASAVLNMAGGMLVNAIAPIRMPTVRNPGSAEAQQRLQGGANRAAPYEAIPVVLGRHRYAPPLGAQVVVESNTSTSYLRMILVWGYGPLQVSDLRIGDTPLDSFEEVEHETLTGWTDDTAEDRTRFNKLYGQDVTQLSLNVLLESDGTSDGSPWTSRVIDGEVDRIRITLHFPEGLRQMPVEGGNAGKIFPARFRAQIQVRQLDPATGAALSGWGDIEARFNGQAVALQPAWFNTDDDAELEPVYRWTRLSLDEHCKLVVRTGAFTSEPDANPAGTLLLRQQQAAYGVGTSYARLPDYGASEEPLWDICVRGNSVHSTVDRRGTGTAGVDGCGLSVAGLTASIAAGTLTRAQAETLRYGGGNDVVIGPDGGITYTPKEPFHKRKDAFSTNIAFDVPRGTHEVRIRRTNSSESTYTSSAGNEQRRMHAAYVTAVTGYANRRPVVEPRGARLAMTAVRIKASNQLNGSLDGISGTVQCICPDYDRASGTWVTRATRNPASVFRWVLQHPANARRVADSRIDLAALQDWHDYCRVNRFMFDAVLTAQRSLDDTLADIAAAGRASHTRRDGRWTVIIDRPRSSIAQHFTPHNSWGFKGVRTLPVLPHAFRVQFQNAERGYQDDELIVYADGYSAANASLFEGLQLPGVTTPAAVYKHARFHLAQLILRPETYTLNADWEHIVCTRGDLVRVTHDVPLWGLASCRIRRRVSATVLELDELLPMKAGAAYTVRIRTATGGSLTRNVVPAPADGHYAEITLTAAVTSAEGEAGNLVMFGELDSESVELVVLGIEPAENLTARITLTDYAGPQIYQVDTQPIPPFDSQVTRPPVLLQPTIAQRPTVASIVSDETVMQLLAPGRWAYRIRVTYTSPAALPAGVSAVEAQIDYADDAALDWARAQTFALQLGLVEFGDVEEGEAYRIRLRYVDDAGRTGPWTQTQVHTVVGKTTPPGRPTGLALSVEGTRLRARWSRNPELDVVGYELRASDDGWGEGGALFSGDADTCTLPPGAVGVPVTWYLRALDAAGLYSTTSAAVSYTVAPPSDVANLTRTFADTSLTAATITLDWPDAAPVFGLQAYRVSYPGGSKVVRASTITLPANWIGDRDYAVQVIDGLGNASPGLTRTVTKLRPGPVSGLRAQVVDNQVELRWTLPARTTLPVSHVLIRRGAAWAAAADVGQKSGTFTSIQELQSGVYTYWVAAVDTDGWESAAPVSIAVTVGSPPDLVVHGNLESGLAGSTASALAEED